MKKTTKQRRYRYVSKDGKKHTRWREVPADGLRGPSKHAVRRLGKNYGVEITK